MKNLISIITSVFLTATILSPVYSSAVNVSGYKIPFVSMKSDSVDIDLNELALSLEADTDYFNFPNYTPNDSKNKVSDEIISKFMRNLTLNEVYSNTPAAARSVIAEGGGACYGMSVLQVLVHNGIISASDIQEGAETLNDIKFDSSVNDIIAYYHMTQELNRQYLNARHFFCMKSAPDKIQTLIQYAENSMKTGRYFHISYILEDAGGHSVVGIGIADGSWTFHDLTYDKCILTLDSNSIDADGNGGGFNKQTCIYINTSDNTFCIPGYDTDETNADESNIFILNVTDDEKILNHKGLISPPQDSDETKSNIACISVTNKSECGYDVSVIRNGTESTYHGTKDKLDISEYGFNTYPSKNYYIDGGEVYKINVTDIDDDELDTAMNVSLMTETSDSMISGDGKFSATIEPHKVSVTNNVPVTDANKDSPTGIGDVQLFLHSDDSPYKNSRFSSYQLWGRCNGTLSMEEHEDGILIRHSAPLDAKIYFKGTKTLEDGSVIYYGQGSGADVNQISYEVYSTADNLWTYDDKINDLVIYADPDGDGIFDKKVEPGDVNCDGLIDATDASKILEIYANLSTDCPIASHILKKRYSDFNNDGMVDAVDASGVLARYAELSTNN